MPRGSHFVWVYFSLYSFLAVRFREVGGNQEIQTKLLVNKHDKLVIIIAAFSSSVSPKYSFLPKPNPRLPNTQTFFTGNSNPKFTYCTQKDPNRSRYDWKIIG